MNETLMWLGPVIGAVVTLLADRVRYRRQIAKQAELLLPLMPGGTAREIAERAIVELNLAEARAAIRTIEARPSFADVERRALERAREGGTFTRDD
jgi:hypothetical protein